ncbi:hypothetical protein [Candidatus Methylobacter oryzae]|uniref:DUF2281 domain-containing protein n=1 Tax=Candidatus Methylobacter oryzae TaxID=2497749 RepID=A0ABY3C7U8_9GAMM|nr:hypothetical protein [Candidatus Methylobacter oryzae]TRW92187.1 hypothetical protein EKO24_015275 [Candidatus Methylobacter oryzae]
MQAIKAIYKEGNIQLLSPLVGVGSEAELFVVVLDKNDQASGMAESLRAAADKPEQEFQAIGLASFFDTEDDNNVDWEELFDAKAR